MRRFTRREMLLNGALASGAICLSPAVAGSECESAGWLGSLAKSARGDRDATPEVEGRLPRELNGDLFRNGPGLFERDGYRKQHLLDGDGLVQKLSLRNGHAEYRNRFVNTPKYAEEDAAKRFIYPTWATMPPPAEDGGPSPHDIRSQAGVTVYPVGDRVYALDETNPLYEIDADSLRIKRPLVVQVPSSGEASRSTSHPGVAPKAHAKLDPATGQWHLVGQSYGRYFREHFFSYDSAGRQLQHLTFQSPRNVYYHDFLLTEKHVVYILHPAAFRPLPFLRREKTFVGSLEWVPDEGSLVAVLPRSGGEPRYFEAPPSFVWHAFNAYEAGSTIVADFIGYDEPDMFIGENALFERIMHGCEGRAASRGRLRRYVIDLKSATLREEIVDHGTHEFPMVDPRSMMREHRIGYMTAGTPDTLLETGIKRFDFDTGEQQVYDFGPDVYVGEPVFAAGPSGVTDQGWLISQCLDGKRDRAFFAVFDAHKVADGPLAKLWLGHHLPIGFHGWWRGMS